MKKTFLLFSFVLCLTATKAQITTYNNVTQNAFYGIGGYSFSQGFFQGGVRPNPDVVSGPSPQNDFSYTVSSTGGLQHVYTYISTLSVNKSITLQFNGNNIRKFGCKATAINIPTGQATTEPIFFVATTNLGNIANQTASLTEFVGFNVSGNENEYIVSVVASFVNPSTNSIAINNIIIGDNTPQNVALNFDGVDDYVSVPLTVGNFATNTDFTVTCWIKPDPTQTTQSGQNPDQNDIISKWAGLGAGANNNYPFVIRYLNNTKKILVGQWDGTNFPTITSTTSVNDGKWHHVAFVKSGSILRLYIDGVQEGGDITDNATGATQNATPLQFGRRGNNESYFKGEIDEVRIWTVAKTSTQIADERFCKTPNSFAIQSSFDFGNGVPHGTNTLISQINNTSYSPDAGTLNNFAKTGDASNFVTGQVKYVRRSATAGLNNGSSWANAFTSLQSALVANTCNDLFDVYVFRLTYRPDASDVNVSFNIPSGMRMYGGFDGTEKSINQRNLALIDNTNQTTLSGDLAADDILSDFTQNRSDNSKNVVNISNKSNILIDGFSIRGGFGAFLGGGIVAAGSNNCSINRIKFFDNQATTYGGAIFAKNVTNLKITNSSFLGNKVNSDGDALFFSASDFNTSVSLNNCVIAGHIGNVAIYAESYNAPPSNTPTSLSHNYTNCTFVNNNRVFGGQMAGTSTQNLTLKNSIIYGNSNNNDYSPGSFQNITNSLVQGETSTANGNLVGTTNPQFVNPASNDYRLKWCSKAINAGTNAGISPLDLDRNPRNFNGTADMGAYEFLGNTPSQVNNSTISGTIDSPTYAGGAIQTITSTAKILAPAGAIDFKTPNSITLNPGFEARGMSSYFKAQIGANSVCTN